MERKPSREIKRHIGYSETMKKRATEKYIAKIRAYDVKIEELQAKLIIAEAEESTEPATTTTAA